MSRPPLNSELAIIDTFVLDCLISDDHNFESEVSEYPVESGATISDHVRNKPLVVTMEAVVSNSPLPPLSTIRARTRDAERAPADEAYDYMMKLRDDKRTCTIRTSLRTYDKMVLQSLSIPRNAARGDALKFTAKFVQIETVTSVRGVRVAIPTAQKGKTVNKAPNKSDLVNRLVDEYDGTWFDPDINGRRYGASYNYEKGHWEFFKGKPVGVTDHKWQTGERLTDQQYREANELGLVPVDKKTGRMNQNAGQQFRIVTDPASIDAARSAGATDSFGNPLP